MSITLDLPDEALVRLRAEAARRKMTLEALIAELADALPSEDELESFIGCGASGDTEPLDIHRERSGLAARRNAATA
ncbi:MAG: hypothetical protein ACE367_02280 [Acidimicrobiales bacterium]